MDLVHYDVIIWGSPSGAMHCAFCTRQNVVVPPLSHVKRPEFFFGVSQDLAISQTGYITRKSSEKTLRHIIKVCESVIKERRNCLFQGEMSHV